MGGPATSGSNGKGNGSSLTRRERAAVSRFLALVRREVPAELVHALLFGSKARGTARPDSDVDLLLIFRHLPPDREPQATIAEDIAEWVSREAGVPVGPWSVSLVDLEQGRRTPMLVDALEDGVPIWPAELPSPRPPFTPDDALHCSGALLDRVTEGSEEASAKRRSGDLGAATRRGRDDLVRMCTAALLLHGETRPRRAESVRRFIEEYVRPGFFPPDHMPVLRWAARSFGPDGHDEDRAPTPPPGGFGALADAVDALWRWVARGRESLDLRRGRNGTGNYRWTTNGAGE
jgi:predicted nucleotidyltransferase